MYDLGLKIKTIRQKRGLTQKELALRINKSISTISSYEINAQLPPLDVIADIALTLNVSLDYLAGIEKTNTFSTKHLTAEEAELLDLIFCEFHTRGAYSGMLTQEQILIIQKMIHYFVSK